MAVMKVHTHKRTHEHETRVSMSMPAAEQWEHCGWMPARM